MAAILAAITACAWIFSMANREPSIDPFHVAYGAQGTTVCWNVDDKKGTSLRQTQTRWLDVLMRRDTERSGLKEAWRGGRDEARLPCVVELASAESTFSSFPPLSSA